MLSLPASASQVLAQVIIPSFAHLLPAKFDSPEARAMLLASGGQESGFATRQQIGGPAHGLWQNEQGGMVHGVLTNSATSRYARSFCSLQCVAPIESDVYAAIKFDDLLACAIARLGLWADPQPLPALGDEQGAWACYLRNWRPGKPRPDSWPANYAAAVKAVAGASA
jgi:hypothetical protein